MDSELRSVLLGTDMMPPSIQRSAAAMLRHYDRVPSVAVDDWRQSLATCRDDQLLPLLYVANEVLQTSKRNRGTKFLEAFSPVLSSCLRMVCERNPAVIEKVRRVIKIWGDRRIYSSRFIGEVLGALDHLRGGGSAGGSSSSGGGMSLGSSTSTFQSSSGGGIGSSGRGAGFGSTASATSGNTFRNGAGGSATASSSVGKPSTYSSSASSTPSRPATGAGVSSTSTLHEKNSDSMDTPVGSHDQDENDNDDDDDSFSFASPGSNRLKLEVALAAPSQTSGSDAADRRNSLTRSGTKRKRQSSVGQKKSVKKKKSLIDLLDEVDGLTGQFKLCQGVLGNIPEEYFSTDESAIADLVGDELSDMYAKVNEAQRSIGRQKAKLFHVANSMHGLEKELQGSVPSLEESIRQDDADLKLCRKLEKKIKLLLVVHGVARDARTKRRAEEARKRDLAEAEQKQREEQAERKRALQEAMKAQEAQPGMIWNPSTKEYQHVTDHTVSESWRD